MSVHIKQYNAETQVTIVIEEIDAELAIAAAKTLGIPVTTQPETDPRAHA